MLRSIAPLCLIAVCASAQPVELKTASYALSVTPEGAITVRRGAHLVFESLPAGFASITSRTGGGNRANINFEGARKGSNGRLELTAEADRIRVRMWLLDQSGAATPRLQVKLEPSGRWYGGGFQGWRAPQTFPLNEAKIATKWFLADGNTQGTPAWYATRGAGLWVRTPHDLRYGIENGVLSVEVPDASSLDFDILIGRNIREIVDRINREIGLPKTTPPDEYFRMPIYTTWVEHKEKVDQKQVIEFAKAIRTNKLPAGVIELDDKWEKRYGDTNFDDAKFPDVAGMNRELHAMGFRTTLWVHPFVNADSKTFADPAMRPLLMADSTGNPGLIRWWQGVAAVWDFTNPRASAEFIDRLKKMEALGFDGFKFDGGDVNLVPRDMKPFRPITPAEYADVYNREATAKFAWEETRVGTYSQPLGVVQRLIDKHSTWGLENGLAAIVPEAITVSMRGFAYVMPDMVGGNQYDGDKVDKELLIRWAQASALMPLLQFSVGPWHFDEEAVRLCREASELHIRYAPYIISLAKAFPKTGEPILRPLWYNAPDDPETHSISDQFMLGNDIVVAPVMTKGAVTRRLYLPKGTWTDLKSGKAVEGGRWLDAYPAPLDTLPVFVRAGAKVLQAS